MYTLSHVDLVKRSQLQWPCAFWGKIMNSDTARKWPNVPVSEKQKSDGRRTRSYYSQSSCDALLIGNHYDIVVFRSLQAPFRRWREVYLVRREQHPCLPAEKPRTIKTKALRFAGMGFTRAQGLHIRQPTTLGAVPAPSAPEQQSYKTERTSSRQNMLSKDPRMMQRRTQHHGVEVGKERRRLRDTSTPVLNKGEAIINGRQVLQYEAVCLFVCMETLKCFAYSKMGFKKTPAFRFDAVMARYSRQS